MHSLVCKLEQFGDTNFEWFTVTEFLAFIDKLFSLLTSEKKKRDFRKKEEK